MALHFFNPGTNTGGPYGRQHAASVSLGRELYVQEQPLYDTEHEAFEAAVALALLLSVSVGSLVDEVTRDLGLRHDGTLPLITEDS